MSFEVASVRESPPATSWTITVTYAPHSGSVTISNFDVMNLLAVAYGVRRDQVGGAPLDEARYNIQAKTDAATDAELAALMPAPAELERKHMVQQLLADRFLLKVHWEKRDGAVGHLVVAKKGARLVEAKAGTRTEEQKAIWGDGPMPRMYQRSDKAAGHGYEFVGQGCSMSDLAEYLAGQFERPVFDRTGLTGTYDFVLRYHGIHQGDRRVDDLDPVPSLDVSLEDTLGLKLEAARGPVKVLVIDHIEKPSPN